MKFICTQENLHQGLLVASHINTKNINLPILNNVLLRVKNNTLWLVSTNLEIALTTKIRGKAESDGEYTVPSKLLADYVSFLPKENVTLCLEDGFLHVSCANKTTKIKGMDSNDFPVIPQVEKKEPIYINNKILKQALLQTAFAVLPNESRPEISGVLFNFLENRLTLVSTDSFRLTEKKILLDEKSAKLQTQIIIPLRTVWELSNILSNVFGEDDLVEVCLDEGQIFFNYNGTELTSRLIEGSFPDYNQIIPKDFNTTCVLSLSELVSAVKSASLFSRSGLNDIKINILSSGTIEVYSTDNQTGEQKTSIQADISGKDNKIVLNHKYLVDGLNNMNASEIKMDVIDENSPCIIRPKDDNNYQYIVMPIKQ